MAGKDADKNREELLAEIEALKTQLAGETTARTAAEEMAHSMASGHFQSSMAESHATGKTVMVSVCVNPHVRDAKKHVYKEVEFPTYFYNIQLPAGAGTHLSTNGIEYHHGQTYEFEPMQLAEMKSRVARCWDHERSIHGDNENAYRKPANHHLISKASAARGAH